MYDFSDISPYVFLQQISMILSCNMILALPMIVRILSLDKAILFRRPWGETL
jgi:hypothetical protein